MTVPRETPSLPCSLLPRLKQRRQPFERVAPVYLDTLPHLTDPPDSPRPHHVVSGRIASFSGSFRPRLH